MKPRSSDRRSFRRGPIIGSVPLKRLTAATLAMCAIAFGASVLAGNSRASAGARITYSCPAGGQAVRERGLHAAHAAQLLVGRAAVARRRPGDVEYARAVDA